MCNSIYKVTSGFALFTSVLVYILYIDIICNSIYKVTSGFALSTSVLLYILYIDIICNSIYKVTFLNFIYYKKGVKIPKM